jgi:hypothetical protein
VIRTRVASNPINAASAGEAIIGDATACSINARNRSGELRSTSTQTQIMPAIVGTATMVHAVAANTIPGCRK